MKDSYIKSRRGIQPGAKVGEEQLGGDSTRTKKEKEDGDQRADNRGYKRPYSEGGPCMESLAPALQPAGACVGYDRVKIEEEACPNSPKSVSI